MEIKKLENLLVCDTETGGLNPITDALMSVTIKVFDKDIIETFYIKEQSKLNYNPKALEKNGLTIDFINEKGISEIEAIGKIVNFISTNFQKKPNIIGQNIGFDIDFLNQLFIRNNMHSFNSLIWHQKRDTQVISRFFQDAGEPIEKVNLSDAYKYFVGIELENAHTSEADVIATEKLYKAQIEKIKRLKNESI